MRIAAVGSGLVFAGALVIAGCAADQNAQATSATTQAQPASATAPAESSDRPPAGRQCFFNGNINGFAAQDSRTVNIRVGVRDFYRMELMGSCPDVNWRDRIAIRSRGSNWICSGLDAELIVPSRIGPQRCPVSNIRKLTEAEVTALPRGARP